MGFSTWLKESFPVDTEALIKLTAEPIPNHLKRWWWALGGTPLYMFVVQVITGIMLIFYYVPDADKAYDSIAYITYYDSIITASYDKGIFYTVVQTTKRY